MLPRLLLQSLDRIASLLNYNRIWPQCIVRWSEHQLEHGKLGCPVCRREYRSVYYACVMRTFKWGAKRSVRRSWFGFRRHWFTDEDKEDTCLTEDHLKRRAVYFSGDSSRRSKIDKPVSSVLKRRSVTDEQSQMWIRRELQALMGVQKVDFVADIVTEMTARMSISTALRDRLAPFIGNYAEIFEQELLSFLNSGLNLRGFDELVEQSGCKCGHSLCLVRNSKSS